MELPEKDCLVLYQDEIDRKRAKDPYWIQVNWHDDDEDCPAGWKIAYSDESLDVDNVITWRELLEVAPAATVLDQFDALKASLENEPHPADMMQAARDFRDGEE